MCQNNVRDRLHLLLVITIITSFALNIIQPYSCIACIIIEPYLIKNMTSVSNLFMVVLIFYWLKIYANIASALVYFSFLTES